VGIHEVATRFRRWARAHAAELCILGAGILVRLSMALLYDARLGYDFNAHWPNIRYVAERQTLPPPDYNTESCQSPLYYVIAAAMVARGLDAGAVGWLGALWGVARLALIWAGLEKWLPESRLARVTALALAAVLPASAHLDGMITNETLVMLVSAAVFVAAPSAIAAARTGGVAPMVGLSLLLALAVMSKVSAFVLLVAIAGAIGIEIVRAAPPSTWWRALRARARPLIAGALVLAAVAGPFFVRNKILYGDLSPTAYEGWLKAENAPYAKIPYFQRRPPGFYLAWNLAIYVHPLYPSALKPDARFFPVLLASTFNDYYTFSFSGGGQYNAQRWIPAEAFTMGAMSIMAGTPIALVTVIAWFAAMRALWRRREDGEPDPRFALLLAPPGALLGALHFATKYPDDHFGPIKGAYLQFIAPILCALFGVGVAWMWRGGRRWRAAALLAMGALAVVAAYTAQARFPRFGTHAYRGAPFFQPHAIAPAQK